VVYNNEVDAIILATDTARAIEDLLRTWMATATPITLRAWEQRSWREWVHERVARLFRKLL
jgi:phosphatidylserine/phosphatidylglycerophosphate/cardiolipin synthase-like enzyme